MGSVRLGVKVAVVLVLVLAILVPLSMIRGTIAARRDGDHVRIEVCDDGPGLEPAHQKRVFERFYSLPRPDGGSRSSGLGLPFVAQVAALHRGRAKLIEREGGGSVARIVLPRA